MQPRKVPIRRCSGCGEGKPKKELVRVVRAADGAISLDLTGKKPGRGAFICPNPACLAKARKAKRLGRSFNCAVPDEVYDQLEKQLAGEEGADGT